MSFSLFTSHFSLVVVAVLGSRERGAADTGVEGDAQYLKSCDTYIHRVVKVVYFQSRTYVLASWHGW